MGNRGFSLVEVLVALVMLALLVVGLSRFTGGFVGSTGRSAAYNVATLVARERLDLVLADPRYTRLSALYGACAGTDSTGFPGYPRMVRRTMVCRDQSGSPPRDLTTITVRVSDPGMQDTVALTGSVARP